MSIATTSVDNSNVYRVFGTRAALACNNSIPRFMTLASEMGIRITCDMACDRFGTLFPEVPDTLEQRCGTIVSSGLLAFPANTEAEKDLQAETADLEIMTAIIARMLICKLVSGEFPLTGIILQWDEISERITTEVREGIRTEEISPLRIISGMLTMFGPASSKGNIAVRILEFLGIPDAEIRENWEPLIYSDADGPGRNLRLIAHMFSRPGGVIALRACDSHLLQPEAVFSSLEKDTVLLEHILHLQHPDARSSDAAMFIVPENLLITDTDSPVLMKLVASNRRYLQKFFVLRELASQTNDSGKPE